MQQYKSHSLVTLKGFGDFVIAVNAASNIYGAYDRAKLQLIAGRHVAKLADALGVSEQVSFVGVNDTLDVPAIYDLKRCGFIAGARSLLVIQRHINKIPSSSALIFDRLGWREHLIGVGHALCELPRDSGNIYVAYARFFERLGYKLTPAKSRSNFNFKKAIIIPGARMKHRVIPSKIIHQIAKKLLLNCVETKVILIDGESFEIPLGVPVEVIPRQFAALISTIKSADLVICADSLPAHLSEFFDVPVFVFTPIPDWSIYWLPKSAFYSEGMASFEDAEYFDRWLDSR